MRVMAISSRSFSLQCRTSVRTSTVDPQRTDRVSCSKSWSRSLKPLVRQRSVSASVRGRASWASVFTRPCLYVSQAIHANAGMRMPQDDMVATYSHVVNVLRAKGIAYLHVIQPGVSGPDSLNDLSGDNDDFVRMLWGDSPYITAGGYDRETAMSRAEAHNNELVCFGRPFTSNVMCSILFVYLV